MNIGNGKLSDTLNYTGILPPQPTNNGTIQCGAFAGSYNNTVPIGPDVLEGLPAAVRVQLPAATNPTITQVGPQEYAVNLSLSQAQTLRLVPGMADSLQNASSAVAPNVFIYKFQSRNIGVATVSATGL